MIDKSWRQCIQFKVAHTVRTYYHRSLLLVEGIYHRLQGTGRRIQVVTIQLYGKPATTVIVNGKVPTATDTQVCAFWYDMDEFGLRIANGLKHFCRPVR